MFKCVFCMVCSVFVLTGLPGFSAGAETAVSTEGIELQGAVVEKSKPDADIKNEQKERMRRYKICTKAKKQIRKQDYIKQRQEKELELLEKRLEAKKEKLNSLTADE